MVYDAHAFHEVLDYDEGLEPLGDNLMQDAPLDGQFLLHEVCNQALVWVHDVGYDAHDFHELWDYDGDHEPLGDNLMQDSPLDEQLWLYEVCNQALVQVHDEDYPL